MSSQAGKATPRLEVYLSKSVLVREPGITEEFPESEPSAAAKSRLAKIKEEFENGYLHKIIEEQKKSSSIGRSLDTKHLALLSTLVDSVTSEAGRALVGIVVLQLCVKAIAPDQSIRLHKSGGGTRNFSWREGIPMRNLDKNYITPVLREHGLLKLNADGFMMTRSLAENYPYSKVYKAAMRGARDEWLELVEMIETGALQPEPALQELVRLLLNRSDAFLTSASVAMSEVEKSFPHFESFTDVLAFMRDFVSSTDNSARILEVSMHSLFQVLEDQCVLPGLLKPLSQMRSANKKHGNVGDIEVITRSDGKLIVESWDAKFGKSDLRDEIEELADKLADHPETILAGFVTDMNPAMRADMINRIEEIEQLHDLEIKVLHFDNWVEQQFDRAIACKLETAKEWLIAFAESLCQRRRTRAPIDEPCDDWVSSLTAALQSQH